MAWNAKKISVVAGALALVAEAGINNGLITGLLYATASSVAAPVVVHGVVLAYDAEEARLASDRSKYATDRPDGHHISRATKAEAGDADQPARQTDASADDSPDMPRRLEPMLVARRTFLAAYDPSRGAAMIGALDKMLRDDRRALKSFDRRAEREPVWAAVHRADLDSLRDMDAKLDRLRTQIAAD